jgi:hypothetical protein
MLAEVTRRENGGSNKLNNKNTFRKLFSNPSTLLSFASELQPHGNKNLEKHQKCKWKDKLSNENQLC